MKKTKILVVGIMLIIAAMMFSACGTDSKCPNGHTEVVDPAKEATCTESGLTEGKHCSVCGKVIVKQETVPAKGHTPEVTEKGVAATCTEDGMTDEVKCSVCKEIISAKEVIKATGHKPGEWITDKEASYSEKGSKHVACGVCGKTLETAEIAKLQRAASDFNVTIAEPVSIKTATGVGAGGVAGWGNHESRIVHTSHGDYAAYTTGDTYNDETGVNVLPFAAFKIYPSGTVTKVFDDLKVYDSSGVTLFADKDENVWVLVVNDNRRTPQLDVAVTAYRIDAFTDEVTVYFHSYEIPLVGSGFGYGGAAYDPYTNKIIAEIADGDPSYGDDKGTIEWFLFDVRSLTWDPEYRQINVDNRYCYPFIMPDGRGGMYIIAGRDYRCTSAGYPEIGDHNTGVEWKTAPAKTYRNYDQSAGYVWDSERIFYIPDMTVSEGKFFWAVPADYSKVENQSQEERYKIENRIKNWYPNFQINNGGDVFIDSEGYLHVIWYKQYLYAASTRAEADNMFYHDVYDIRNVKSLDDFSEALLVSSSPIKNGVADGKCYSFRLFEDEEGNLFYISASVDKTLNDDPLKIKSNKKGTGVLTVYYLEGTPETGYTFTEIAEKKLADDYMINISNRGSLLVDGHVGAIIMKGSDYLYYGIEIATK